MRIKDTETFIEKAKIVHGDKYDYSKSVYKDKNTKVCIICPEHGEFWQTPYEHVHKKHGCRKCSFEKRSVPTITTEEWIERAKMIHGDKYDYSKSIYKNQNTKLCIICPEHGEFWQTPTAHTFLKEKCPKCANHYTCTTDEWIERAKQIHGNKYDYSKTVFNGALKKVRIICPEHGEFWQMAHSHLEGCGCKKCSSKYRADLQRKDREQFIKEAEKIHGKEYDYSKVKYANANTKVCIICPEHGEFWQTPVGHINNSQKCPLCQVTSKMENLLKSLLENDKIEYIKEQKFSWLKYINLLRVDFYLPDFNIIIECQGEQHFKPVKKYGGEKTLEVIKERDNVKYESCTKHGLFILYVIQNRSKKYIKNNPMYKNVISYETLLKENSIKKYLNNIIENTGH